jgi:hypothetical protein
MRHVALNAQTVHAVLSEWLRLSPGLGVMALVPEAEKENLPQLQRVCVDLGISLVGGIFPALICQGGFKSDGVWLIPFESQVPVALIPALEGSGSVAAEKIAEAALGMLESSENTCARPTLFLMFDGMLPNIGSTLEHLYSRLADRVRYAGVNAGSETFQPMPCLFNENEVIGNGVLALLFPGDSTTVLAHGYRPPEKMLSATSTEGNRISMIDWRPAFEVYQEIIKAEYGIELTTENFYQYGVHYPFGMLRANAEVVVRMPVAIAEDGSLFCIGEVPENAMLVLLKSPSPDQDGCIQGLAKTLETEHGDLHDRRLLTFYCAGRRMHLGEGAEIELDVLTKSSAVAELAGAVSLGEIGCTQLDGYPMFHNATLVCTAWGKM